MNMRKRGECPWMGAGARVAGLALLFSGCATPPAAPDAIREPVPLTRLTTDRAFVTPRDLAGSGPITVALINVDFSRSHILLDLSVGVFEPRGNRGDVYLSVRHHSESLGSLAAFREALLVHVTDVPIGVIMMLNGSPLGVAGHVPKPEQQAFFREFALMMADAGIVHATIVPEKLTISR